jgi:hypothetical protein
LKVVLLDELAGRVIVGSLLDCIDLFLLVCEELPQVRFWESAIDAESHPMNLKR